jgi:Rrf2 family protein
MIYSNACAYAIRALSRLAMLDPEGYVLLDDLCANTDLPRHFMAKIFQDLVRKGLLLSAKGRGGGFALARHPQEITLLDIVRCVDGLAQVERCVVGMTRCDDAQPCPQHDQWMMLRDEIKTFLAETTLQDMAETFRRKLELAGMPLPVVTSRSKPVTH